MSNDFIIFFILNKAKDSIINVFLLLGSYNQQDFKRRKKRIDKSFYKSIFGLIIKAVFIIVEIIYR